MQVVYRLVLVPQSHTLNYREQKEEKIEKPKTEREKKHFRRKEKSKSTELLQIAKGNHSLFLIGRHSLGIGIRQVISSGPRVQRTGNIISNRIIAGIAICQQASRITTTTV